MKEIMKFGMTPRQETEKTSSQGRTSPQVDDNPPDIENTLKRAMRSML